MTQQEFIDHLYQKTADFKTTAENVFTGLGTEMLYQKPEYGGWSIAACLHHLNLYGDYYLPELRKAIEKGKRKNKQHKKYRAGWLGNYFANSMLPKAGKLKSKMKTFADKDPDQIGLPDNVLTVFIRQQSEMLELLSASRQIDLAKNRVPISITKWIKLKLGDTFHFVINHNERHMWQIENIMKTLKQLQSQ